MLNLGDILEIRGKEACVCFLADYKDDKYMCVSFDEDTKINFDIFKYKFENDKFMVSKVEDQDELSYIMGVFYQQGLEQFGIDSRINDKFLELFENKE